MSLAPLHRWDWPGDRTWHRTSSGDTWRAERGFASADRSIFADSVSCRRVPSAEKNGGEAWRCGSLPRGRFGLASDTLTGFIRRASSGAISGLVKKRSWAARHAATVVKPSPSSIANDRSTSASRRTSTSVVSITATPRPAESTTSSRSPTAPTGDPSRRCCSSRPVVDVFSPRRIAATRASRSGPGKANSPMGRSSCTVAS